MASDVAQVYRVWSEYAAAIHAGDLDRWLALWAEDAIQMPPDTPRRVGRTLIRQGMQPLFENYAMSNMVIHTQEVRILGDRAYSHGTYTCDLTPKTGGETASCSGSFLDILVRQVDGSWKIAVDCHNTSQPSA